MLLIDVINPVDFEGGAAFARRSGPAACAIRRLRDRATTRGIPVIYVNDNLGQWRSDISDLVRRCTGRGMPGAGLVELLKPRASDYVILKATLSGFYQSALDTHIRLARRR